MFNGNNTIEADVFSEEGKQVTDIQWRNIRGQLPEKPTLKKWTVGDRTYYQVSGPINPAYRDTKVANWQAQWCDYMAIEVFFTRGGTAYDQWLITPQQCTILHFDQGKSSPLQSDSSLPNNRFRTLIKGNRIVTTFWCSKHDTPANIVFNYNQGNGKNRQPLCWTSTDERCEKNTWVHHVPKWWTYP